MAATTPPLLTNITKDQLECTLHCPDYQCVLKLWSSIGGGPKPTSRNNNINDDNDAKSRISSIPEISSIGVIPIDASINRDVNSETKIIHLLPALRNDGDKESCEEYAGYYPCHELIRISHAMQAQLKERLQDASDGALIDDLEAHSNGTMEIFLLRCEAVFRELLSAVQMLKRRDEGSTSQRNNKIVSDVGGGGTKKRSHGSIASSSSSIAAQPPPLEYYHALLRQLHTLQHNMPNVTDISLHKDNSTNNNSNNANNANENTAKDLTRVSITCQDSQQRVHTWHAELYPTIVLTVDLPNEFVLDDIVQGMNNMNVNKWWVHSDDNSDDEDDMSNKKINGAPSSSSSSLSQYHQQLLPRIQQHFETTLNSHQKLFDELDDIDSNLWILEPTLPVRRACVERRIALWEGGASIVIVLDHEKPRGIPIMVRFLGVTTAMVNAVGDGGGGSGVFGSVADWRASFADFVAQDETTEEDGRKRKRATDDVSKANISNDEKKKNSSNNNDNKKRWSEERSIRENLELWLGSPLPSPLSTEKSDYLVECGICYAHRLPILTNEDDTDTTTNDEEGPLPEEKCSNPSCNRYYHESCLFEWLHSLPTARVSFDRIFGTCPYCCEGVSVKVLNQAQH
ncbi:hypothetical protein ACHAWC_008618 [Mediolabrus comicus]